MFDLSTMRGVSSSGRLPYWAGKSRDNHVTWVTSADWLAIGFHCGTVTTFHIIFREYLTSVSNKPPTIENQQFLQNLILIDQFGTVENNNTYYKICFWH